jgi:prepilin-type N-terminal cleavage/methylation domain-containing protein
VANNPQRSTSRAFTLIELLAVIGIVSILVSMLLPALRGARESARAAVCSSNLRQMGLAWTMYAGDFKDRAMPLAYWESQDLINGQQLFWWGTYGSRTTPPDVSAGFLTRYLDTPLAARSVLECPSQPWGTYSPQGPKQASGEGWFTSTYGYNGYYLSPAKTPGWGASIGFRSWMRLSDLDSPTTLNVFADTLLAYEKPVSTALLDPPFLFSRNAGWESNPYPTIAARHGNAKADAAALKADGHVRLRNAQFMISPTFSRDFSLLESGIAEYIPDWSQWR